MRKLNNLLYYQVKPIIPKRVRLGFRRHIVKQIMKNKGLKWPIDPSSAERPEGWKGWPGGKRFALVLTHDVEAAEGLKKCHKLMELEESLGFRSSFNLVATDYEISDELVKELKERGFEIGVHGLKHKGNPFGSESVFRKQAKEINKYLKQWGSVGFRSPSMYHELKMLHYLDIEYDASTFDTDPFEPQPDGVGTIFPVWIYSDEHKKGYVELPYTLPQDYLIFIIMREKTTDIWTNKLDWIVSNGGMALIIAHPDYMSFDNSKKYSEYPAEFYKRFLLYIKEKYADQYWNPLPKEIARFWKQNYSRRSISLGKKLHIGMPVYSFYESDNRVLRYAEALSGRGDHVEIFALKRFAQTDYEKLNNIDIYRIQPRHRDEKSRLSYLYRLIKFLFKSLYHVSKRQIQYPFDIVHVHSIPDFEVFSSLIAKLRGAKVILDIHDLVPELYINKFNKKRSDLLYRILIWIEKISCKYADHIIISNHLWYETITKRSAEKNKCTVVLNYPDDSIFYPRARKRKDDRFIMMYHGTFARHQGLDIAIRAFVPVVKKFPNAEFHLYGGGSEKAELVSLIKELGAEKNIFINDPVSIRQIAEIIAEADIGIVPKLDDAFGGEAFSTKILEFMSSGIPVVVSATRIDKYYFNESVVKFFKPGDVNDLTKCLFEIINDKKMLMRLSKDGMQFARRYSWSLNKIKYLEIVDKLTTKK